MDASAGQTRSVAIKAPLDWRRWVPAEVRREIHAFMWASFGMGLLLASLAATIYARFSESKDKVFHCAIIIGALGFTMPAFATSLKLMLTMFYMGFWGMEKSESMAKDVREAKDEAKPIMRDVSKVAGAVAEMTERASKDDIVKRASEQLRLEVELEGGFFQRLASRVGVFLDKAEKALEGLAPPPVRKPGLLERGIKPGNGSADKESVPPEGGTNA